MHRYSKDLLTVMYREYTTEGRFITISGFSSHKDMLADDLQILFDGTAPSVAAYYQQTGEMLSTEKLKDVWRTNVMVRDNNRKLVKWAHLLA